jgi:hypothetical protein
MHDNDMIPVTHPPAKVLLAWHIHCSLKVGPPKNDFLQGTRFRYTTDGVSSLPRRDGLRPDSDLLSPTEKWKTYPHT